MGIADLTPDDASVVMGIDTSTNALAFSIMKDGKLKHYGKVYLAGENIYDKCGDANKKTYHLLKIYEPEVVLIEAAVFVNNRQVVKKIASIIGAVGGVAAALGARVDEVAPLSWQSHIGNSTLTKAEKKQLKKENPEVSANKLRTINREFRKQRTLNIIQDTYGVVVTDDDVGDAIGVAWYGSDVYNAGGDED